MYFVTFANSGNIPPQIIGLSSSLTDVEKLIMAKLNPAYIATVQSGIPCMYSIAPPADINNKKHQSIKILEPYSQMKEDEIKRKYNQSYEDYLENDNVEVNVKEEKKPVVVDKSDGIPYVVRYVNHKHIASYFLTYEQVKSMESKYVYYNKVESLDTNIISIFEASSECIDFVHVLNTINQTCYNDGPY
jgi:hypothetical protein